MNTTPPCGTASDLRISPHLVRLSMCRALLIVFALCVPNLANADPRNYHPDLTNGDDQYSDPTRPGNYNHNDEWTWNLGPTGMSGWMYRYDWFKKYAGWSTELARQIEVQVIDAGSPAEGIMQIGDVILGADGTGADPVPFTWDARKAFADAIADAEARSPAELKLLVWRQGNTSIMTLTLETLGAYSATAPYNCPKSAAILEKGLDAIMAGGASDTTKFSLVTLLAGNDPSNPDNAARMARVQQEIQELILTPAEVDYFMSNQFLIDNIGGKIAWSHGFKLVALAEYYLQTGDAAALDSVRAYAVAAANGQSMFGTSGHKFCLPGEDGSLNGPYGIGYGIVNSANMQCFYGLLLAREAGITDQRVLDAIERASNFYGAYVDRGSIPYGEHTPGQDHGENGKNGIAALCYKLQGGHNDFANYYSVMAGASATNIDAGHQGPYLNYLWAALGANAGGEESMAAFFKELRWFYDLAREHDGTFTYNSYQNGGQLGYGGDDWSALKLQIYTACLLPYAAPLRQTYVTGKNTTDDPGTWLTTQELGDVDLAVNYDATTRTTTELLDDLGSVHPFTRNDAAAELGLRTTEHATILPTLESTATDANAPLHDRMGACAALGAIANNNSLTLLIGLLSDPKDLVKYAAAKAIQKFPSADKLAQVDALMTACVAEAKPVVPVDPDDPIHLTHGAIAGILFDGYAGGILRNHDLVGINRDLFYPALSAAVGHPQGRARSWATDIYSNLTKEDVEALAGTIVSVAWDEAPADRMFSGSVQVDSIEVLHKYGFSEGVPLAQETIRKETRDHKFIYDALALYGASSLSVIPDPKTVEFCELKVASNDEATRAQAVLDAIAADTNPNAVTPLKGIHQMVADDTSLTLPQDRTTLRAYAYNHLGAELSYTWRKVHGAGGVTFVRNGTPLAASTEVVFDGVPGEYLFEVTISDVYGLTEVSDTVSVTLNDTGGSLPANNPPTADDQSLSVDAGTPTQIILTGSDPEGNDLMYAVTNGPSQGRLTGTAPDLVYTAPADYSGADSFTFEVMDSEGLVDSATVSITVGTGNPVGLAIYEPFDYVTGTLDGASGATEIGLDGSWVTSHPYHFLDGPTLTFGTLPTTGLRVYSSGGDSFGRSKANAARPIGVNALVNRGLMDDGATLWFSIIMGNIGSTNNMGVDLALANSSLEQSGEYVEDDGVEPGMGIGVKLQGTIAQAAQFNDSSNGSPLMGSWDESAAGEFKVSEQRLVIGKITWGAGSDTVEIYLPYEDMVLPSKPSSTLVANVDQSKFDTLTFASAYWSGTTYLDEIRFGSTLQSVLQGTVDMTADTIAPTPNPMSFSIAPSPVGGSSITMMATPAHDAMEVEYYFTCTAGGGNDSGWQDSNVYTDTGLTPGVQYTYTVKARDKYPALNETAASAAASATIPLQGTLPDVIGMIRDDAESAVTDAGMTVGNVSQSGTYSLTIPAGHVLSQNPAGPASSGYGTLVDLVISIGQNPSLPTLASIDITDDTLGLPVSSNQTITYTLNFSEDMDVSTIDAGDFVNLISYPISIGAITQPSPGVVTVEVTGTGSTSGSILLAIAQGAVITDAQGDALNTSSLIADDTIISVIDSGDTTPPTLASSDIVDDQGGASVSPGTLVTYTVTFSEDMDAATVSSADFGNAGTSSVTIGSVVETSPGVFTVESTPTSGGSLQLQVSASADLTDAAGNALDTSSAIADDTVISVVLPGDTTGPSPDPMSFDVLPTADLGGGGAAGMSASLTPPAVDGADIDISGAETGSQPVWNDRPAAGQVFTTGSEAADLNAVTFLMTNGPATKNFTVRVGSVSGTTFTEIYSESYTQTFDVGTSEYVTFGFTTPIALAANTQYAVDVALTSSTTGWQSGMPNLSYTSDVYAGGQRYNSGGGGAGDTSMNFFTGDHNIHLDLSTGGGGGSLSEDSITMTATTATDSSGVEYYFSETSGNPGGSDSGWQDSPEYTDTGLQAGTEYTYTVTARDKSSNQNTTAPSAPASATTGGTPPSVNTLVYEDFDYAETSGSPAEAATLGGNSGGLGFDGSWIVDDDGGAAGVDDQAFEVLSPGLSLGTLPVAGNSAGRISTSYRAIAYRALSAASQSALLADNSTTWFSVLYQDAGTGDDFAFVFGNQPHKATGSDPVLELAGDAFGFAAIGSSIYAVKHDSATSQTLSSSSLAANGGTYLLVGKINWNSSGTADEFYLFNVADPSAGEPAEGTAFASQLGDFDQSGFSLITMWDRPNTPGVIDEIRFGQSYASVIGQSESGGDTTAPTLAGADIVDDQAGANVVENTLVTYTLTFSEDIDETTIDSSDFSNAGTSSITIGTITETAAGVFTIEMTPTTEGSLQLQVSAGAVITDVSGNSLDTSTAIVDDTTITVEHANTAPVADDQSVTTDEDTAAAVTLTASDTDGDPLTYTVVTAPTNGTLSGTAPDLIYTPNADYNGSDAFTFKTNDGTVDSNTATVSLTVNAVNDAPVADDQSATTNEDTSVAVTLTASDIDGDVLTYTVVTAPANGTLSGTAPDLTYTPNPNYNGSDSFTFVANDGLADSNTATLSITVNAVNDTPVADDQSVTTDEDTAVAVTLTANDLDGDVLSYSVVTAPANGTLSGTAPNLTYTPNADYNGSDSFTFVANDGLADSNTATLSITVNAVNDTPVADDQSVTTDEDTAVAVTLTASDADGDTLTYAVVTAPANGTLSGTAPNLTYTPNADYNGSDSFSFTVNDGAADSNTATVSLTVNAFNDAPVADDQSVTTNEDTAVAVTLTASDIDGDPLTYTVATAPTNGTLSGTAPNLTYTPNADYNGSDSFTFKANDGTTDSNTATVSLTVNAVNDAPVADDQSVTTNEDTPVAVTLTASDVEGDALTYTIVTAPTNGTLSGTAPDLTYTPNTGYIGSDNFTFKTNDGTVDSNTATVGITVYATGVAIIHESFAYDPAGGNDLSGEGPATGTSGTWGGDSRFNLVTGSISYGNLATSGNSTQYIGTGGGGGNIGTTISSDLANAGLLNDSAELWFSVVVNFVDNGNDEAALTLGTDQPFTTDINNSGSGIGFYADSLGNVRAAIYSGGTQPGTHDATANFNGTTQLIVGKVTWGADAASADTVTLYNPGTDLDITGHAFSTVSAVIDQSGLNTLGIWIRNNDFPGETFDEIRFGATYADVVPDGSGSDTTPPTLTSTDIVDDQGGANVTENDLITYTLTFSEDMDETTVDATDFSNAGTSAVTIGAVTETSPGVFMVEATPTNPGSLQLQVAAGATLTDTAGNALDTTSTIIDDTLITVDETNVAPTWTSNPIAEADATEGSAYSATLADDASDANSGDTLSFAKVSGPAWLNISTDGTLSGTPGDADKGGNSFTVSVTDGKSAPVEATLNINVNATATVPNVVGLPQTTAETNIVAADLVVGSVTEEYSQTVAAGDVISQGLSAGSTVPEGSAVDLVVSLGAASSINLVRTTVNSVSNSSWTTVDLGQTYASPVIVATPIHPSGVTTPVVTRISNVTGTSFDLKLDRADGLTAAVNYDVSIIVVEEGVYTQAQDGVTMEAVKFTSTITAGKSNWTGEARSYQNTYTNPVVVGQVMSYNDSNWSVFWSCGSNSNQPIDALSLNVGKHIAEDPNVTRANETIGYIVIESGNGTIDGVAYEAAMGDDTVQSFDNSNSPYNYSLSGSLGTAGAAALSQSAMDGNDGSWAVLYGSNPFSPTNIDLYVSEDQINDSEQRHVTEQVGYIIME